MNYTILLPHPALQPYVHHYAMVTVGSPDRWSTTAMAPPGYGVLGVVVGDKKMLYKDELVPANNESLSLLTYAGQLTQYKEILCFGAQTLVYAVMKPCGFYRLFKIGQHHCTNTNSNLLDFLPEKHRAVKHQFEDCDNPLQTLLILETLLLQLLSAHKEKHQLQKFASITDHLRQQSHQPLLLKKLIKNEGLSKSTLERNFMEFVGINPKQYHRIVRFNNLLTHIRQQKNISHWTNLAYKFGYYDQAHFIKDFKTFYGKTPSAFSTNDELISNITL